MISNGNETGPGEPETGAVAPDGLPRHTTPTWEVELLISGVAVFAMLQLPGMLDDAVLRLLPRFDAGWGEALKLMYVYLKTAVVILATSFSLHLLLRAHWIALVGMHSVYPDGVRWDRLKMGPVQRSYEMSRAGDRASAIDSADNRATTVFAVGVRLASILLVISVLVAILFALMLAFAASLGLHAGVRNVFAACALLAVAPLVVASWFDRRFGARLAPAGATVRVLQRVFAFYRLLGFHRGNNVSGLLASNGGERRTAMAMLAIVMPVSVGMLFGLGMLQHPDRMGGYANFPQLQPDTGRVVDPANYDQRRDPIQDPAVPFVRAPVVIGPYLELVVPYRPDIDDPAIDRTCPKRFAPLDRLDCLGRIHRVLIDGKLVTDLRYDAGIDARTDRPALMAMLDVRKLAPGRHELRVRRALADEDDGDHDSDVIPFWR